MSGTVQWAASAFLCAMVIFLGAMLAWMPNVSRREIYFSVTVPADFRETSGARAVLRRYRLAILIHTLIALGFVLAGPLLGNLFLQPIAIFWLIGGALLAFLAARRRVRRCAASPSPAPEMAAPAAKFALPGGWLLQLGPFGILAAAAIYLQQHWDRIPERFPVHWGTHGANRWASRTPAGVYTILCIGVGACAGIALIAYATRRGAKQAASSESQPGEENYRRATLRVLLLAEYFVACLMSYLSLTPLFGPPGHLFVPVVLALTLAFVLGTTMALARAGRRRTSTRDATDDRYWSGGMFYVNRNDPAILVEKRFGMGYTLNFGNRKAWLLLVAILLLIFGPLLLLRLAH